MRRGGATTHTADTSLRLRNIGSKCRSQEHCCFAQTETGQRLRVGVLALDPRGLHLQTSPIASDNLRCVRRNHSGLMCAGGLYRAAKLCTSFLRSQIVVDAAKLLVKTRHKLQMIRRLALQKKKQATTPVTPCRVANALQRTMQPPHRH